MTAVWKSPNEVKAEAEDLMLDGREAVTRQDWELVVNCWAANLHVDLVEPACQLMVKMYAAPLTKAEVKEIVDFQLERR